MTLNNMKLTPAQQTVLRTMQKATGIAPKGRMYMVSTYKPCQALLRFGFIQAAPTSKRTLYNRFTSDQYELTDAGRAWLAAQDNKVEGGTK